MIFSWQVYFWIHHTVPIDITEGKQCLKISDLDICNLSNTHCSYCVHVHTQTHRHTLSLSQYSVESSINGTNLSSREFLLGRLILGPLQTETSCSIVRSYVRVYSHLALNSAITLCFQTSKQ